MKDGVSASRACLREGVASHSDSPGARPLPCSSQRSDSLSLQRAPSAAAEQHSLLHACVEPACAASCADATAHGLPAMPVMVGASVRLLLSPGPWGLRALLAQLALALCDVSELVSVHATCSRAAAQRLALRLESTSPVFVWACLGTKASPPSEHDTACLAKLMAGLPGRGHCCCSPGEASCLQVQQAVALSLRRSKPLQTVPHSTCGLWQSLVLFSQLASEFVEPCRGTTSGQQAANVPRETDSSVLMIKPHQARTLWAPAGARPLWSLRWRH